MAEACRSCANAGVLGPVPGLIGCMQATETIKLLLKPSSLLSSLVGKQVYYDGMSGESSTFELTSKDPHCATCGKAPTITSMQHTQIFIDDYEEKIRDNKKLPELPASNKVNAIEYGRIAREGGASLLIDVRSRTQFSMQHLSIAGVSLVNVPLKDLNETKAKEILQHIPTNRHFYVLCRRGIDSVRATDMLLRWGYSNAVNIQGGLEAWKAEVDPSFVMY
jgi:rhodanese-related sulfurtransferase